MLVLDGLLVSLSPFLLEDHFHFPLGVLYYGSLHFDMVARKEGVASQGVLTRPYFMDVTEMKCVAHTDVFEVRDGEDVAGC